MYFIKHKLSQLIDAVTFDLLADEGVFHWNVRYFDYKKLTNILHNYYKRN